MKKGFTLIELLAVIVILAIIALIATPIVLSIINDSKESALVRSGEFYVSAVENAIMKKNIELGGTLNPRKCIINEDGNAARDEINLKVDVDGEKPTSGGITFLEGKIVNSLLTFGLFYSFTHLLCQVWSKNQLVQTVGDSSLRSE